ncbi:hydantoinase/oxoprolinase family protein [Nonomuraea glycinis]|uniref:hydantoinase/oxoprolinase family protein n=1 Tax=Nonomuraea glycinis TaxID=2047744 RepID=UPI002E0D1EDB|nr:hydantoinase/oxoprolinase family protein [Nonomuraea glycinis]
MRVGIDVGGTHTDAVLMDQTTVVAEIKTATTHDVTGGVVTALRRLLAAGQVDRARITAVMIGTTHFTNALVTGRGLAPTAVVRLALPATAALPPLVDWPHRLLTAIRPSVHLCDGGHEFDGRPISPLNPEQLKRVAAAIEASGIRSVAVSSVFSPVNTELEEQAAAILRAELPYLHISLSHQIGRVGLVERENATVVNACLRDLADDIVEAFEQALRTVGVAAPLFLSQNDGTLMDADHCRRYPVATFASGPTNSMRGAAFLADRADCAVVDIGGTTTDVGVLTGGYPRAAIGEVDIGGVRTNFRMPDVLSIGLGGGSHVTHALGYRPGMEYGPNRQQGWGSDGRGEADRQGGADSRGEADRNGGADRRGGRDRHGGSDGYGGSGRQGGRDRHGGSDGYGGSGRQGGADRQASRDGLAVGPQSVGYQLTEQALVFGGSVLTATDLAVAAGLADIGDPALVRHLDPDLVRRGIDWMAARVADLVERMRVSAAPLPVIIVGGGSVLMPAELPGIPSVHRPEHHAVANAIGAAIGQIGGDVDRLFAITATHTREDVLDQARTEAVERAVAAGAARDTVDVVEIDEVHVGYLPGNAVRVRVKAVGDLDLARHSRTEEEPQWVTP